MPPLPHSPPPRNQTLRRIATLSALALTVAVLWGVIFDRWRPSDWGVPLSYDGDGVFYLACTKLAERSELSIAGHIFTEALGAPFVGNLNDFPYTDRAMSWVAGFFSRIGGPFFANNLMGICAHILAALSFYLAARLWRISKPVAWGLSIPYAFIDYGLMWHTACLGIIFFGLLPLQLYVCWYLSATPKLGWRSPRFRLAVAISFLSGFNNIYFVVSFALFYFFALLRRTCARHYNFRLAITPSLFTALALTIVLSSFIIYGITNGKNSGAVIRHYADLEWGSLKPFDLVIPKLGQAFGLFDWLYKKYNTVTSLMFPEQTTVYVGLIGIAGLSLLIWNFITRSLARKPIPLPALCTIWTLAFISFGGLVGLFALISDFYMIRAIQRYATIISTISFLYFALGLSRWSRDWHNFPKIALISVIGIGGLADQAWPHFKKWQGSAESMTRQLEEDSTLVTKLETELPAKSMLFMLPIVPFPEGPQYLHEMADYELLKPFLHSKTLRYSYGSHKGRPTTEWQKYTAYLPANKMVTELESYGFRGILINRHGYEDNANSLLEELASAGHKPTIEQGDEWVFIPLTPSPTPKLPHLPYSFPGKWFSSEGTPDNWWRWTSASKNNIIHLYTQESGRHHLTFDISAVSARNIYLTLDGEPLDTINLSTSNLHRAISLILDLPKGENILTLSTDQPPTIPSGDNRALSLCVANLNLVPTGSLSLNFGQNWFPREGTADNWWRWTGTTTGNELNIYSKEAGKYQLTASLGVISPRQVYFMREGEIIQKVEFQHQGEQAISFTLRLNQGDNTITLSTDQSGLSPAGDPRNLAFYIKNAQIAALPPQVVSFDNNWFPKERGGDNWWHWSGKRTGSKVSIDNHGEEGTYELFALVGAINQRKVDVMVNGELAAILEFDQTGEQELSIPLRLRQGNNSLTLSTDQDPIQPDTRDTRELAFYIKNLTIK